MTDQDLEQAVASRIDGFAALPDGWHFGDGISAVAGAMQSAHAINSLLAGYGARNIEVFPCIDGGMLIHGYGNADVLEIQCDPDGQICLAHEHDSDLVWEQENVSIGDIESYLGGLAWLPTSSSVFSSTPSITAGSWVDLPAPPFSRLHLVWGSPCSIHNVESTVAAVSADIFNVSMKRILAAPLSFGGSAPTYYQLDVRSSLHLRPAAISVTGTLQM